MRRFVCAFCTSDEYKKNREFAEISRTNKRERMGEVEFLREKREAAVEYRKRKKAERDNSAAPSAAGALDGAKKAKRAGEDEAAGIMGEIKEIFVKKKAGYVPEYRGEESDDNMADLDELDAEA